MYSMCVCLFSALGSRVGALQISIIIITALFGGPVELTKIIVRYIHYTGVVPRCSPKIQFASFCFAQASHASNAYFCLGKGMAWRGRRGGGGLHLSLGSKNCAKL